MQNPKARITMKWFGEICIPLKDIRLKLSLRRMELKEPKKVVLIRSRGDLNFCCGLSEAKALIPIETNPSVIHSPPRKDLTAIKGEIQIEFVP